MDALAPIGHANERSYVEKRSKGSREQKSHMAPTIQTPQGISQPRQSQSKQSDVALVRQMVLAQQVQEALENFPPLPMPISQLYHILLKECLVAPILPRHIINSPLGESGPFKTCEHHFGSLGHSLEECTPLKGTIQGLIDNNIIQFENATITDSSPTSYKGQVNVLIKNKGQGGSFIIGLSTSPYPYEVSYPSKLLNKGNPRSDISLSSGTTVLDLLLVLLSILLPILLKAKLVELMASEIQPKIL